MKKYFFLDDEHVELSENAERIFHEPVKYGRPVLSPETDLEGNGLHIRNAPLPSEDGRYWRIWYTGSAGDNHLPLYAESEDGLNWRRPNLKLVKYAGSRNNNIVDAGLGVNDKKFNFDIVVATNPSWNGLSLIHI